MLETDDIMELARSARTLLERNALQCPVASVPPMWHQFPAGCCGDTSDILAVVLAHVGVPDVRTVCGYFREYTGCSHAWVEVGELIIDITGDQFNARADFPLPAVFVATDRRWHDHHFVGQAALDTPNHWRHIQNSEALAHYQSLLECLK